MSVLAHLLGNDFKILFLSFKNDNVSEKMRLLNFEDAIILGYEAHK